MHLQPASQNGQTAQSGSGVLPGFDYDPRTRVVYGPNSITRLGSLVRELGGSRILLVTDPGVRSAGHTEPALTSLRAAGIDVTVFGEVRPDPTTEDVDRGLAVARAARIDLIVGLGGGSSMDTAKGINFLLTNGGRMEDYWGVGKATQPMLPLIAIPTTAGTGSEAQSYALIANQQTHMKMACGDKKAACRIALLDPELTLSVPPSVTAATGIDAISHALETYVTTRRNPISQLFSEQAWRLLSQAFPVVMREPLNIAARGSMLLGAHLAGAAIENSMLGATHACANPLSAHYGMAHGVAIGIMLPHVIRFNAASAGTIYGKVAAEAELCDAADDQAAEILAARITRLLEFADLPIHLTECDVDPSLIPKLAEEAASQWTGKFNPRPVDVPDFQELYRCAL